MLIQGLEAKRRELHMTRAEMARWLGVDEGILEATVAGRIPLRTTMLAAIAAHIPALHLEIILYLASIHPVKRRRRKQGDNQQEQADAKA